MTFDLDIYDRIQSPPNLFCSKPAVMENGNIKLNSFNQISSMNFSAHCISKLNLLRIKRKIRLNCFKIANLEPLVVEEVAAPHRYRPDNLNSLCTATGSESLSLSSIYFHLTFTFISFHFY